MSREATVSARSQSPEREREGVEERVTFEVADHHHDDDRDFADLRFENSEEYEAIMKGRELAENRMRLEEEEAKIKEERDSIIKERLDNSIRAQAEAQRGAEEWHESVLRDFAAPQAQGDGIPEVEPAIIGDVEVPAVVVRPTFGQRLYECIARFFRCG